MQLRTSCLCSKINTDLKNEHYPFYHEICAVEKRKGKREREKENILPERQNSFAQLTLKWFFEAEVPATVAAVEAAASSNSSNRYAWRLIG